MAPSQNKKDIKKMPQARILGALRLQIAKH